MNIKSLEKMEEIVGNNYQLSWDGWDVVRLQPRPGAWSSPNAKFYRGKWHMTTVFPITSNGWDIPNKLVR